MRRNRVNADKNGFSEKHSKIDEKGNNRITNQAIFYFQNTKESEQQHIMSQLQRITLYILVLIAGASWVALSTVRSVSNADNNGPAPQVGFAAPDFTLKTSEGDTYVLSDLKGQAILVNLWATWCPPCRAEMPAIEKMYQEYKEQGFVVLAVNSTVQDNPFDIAPFLDEYNLTFPVLLDETGDVSRMYQVRSLPSSFFINRQGIITEVVVGGPMSEALLRTRIEKALE